MKSLHIIALGLMAVPGYASAEGPTLEEDVAPATVQFTVPSTLSGVDANCTINAPPPQGYTKRNISFGGNWSCDKPVDRFRFIVRANPKTPEGEEQAVATDVLFRDYENGETSGGDGGDLSFRDWPTQEITVRTIVEAYKITADWSQAIRVGSVASAYVTFGDI